MWACWHRRMLEEGTVLIEVESTLHTTPCHRCGREIDRFHGFDRPIRLRHLPVFKQRMILETRPKRYRFPFCEDGPTTTQRCVGYDLHRPKTTAFEQDVLKRRIGTVADVTRQLGLEVNAVEALVDPRLAPTVDWIMFAALETLGIDEVALLKGHGHGVAVVWARDADGQHHVLAVLPDRLRATVQASLETLPDALKAHGAAGLHGSVRELRQRGGGGAVSSPGGGGSLSRRHALPGRGRRITSGRMSPAQVRPPARVGGTHRRVAAFADRIPQFLPRSGEVADLQKEERLPTGGIHHLRSPVGREIAQARQANRAVKHPLVAALFRVPTTVTVSSDPANLAALCSHCH